MRDMETRRFITRIVACVIAATAIGVVATPTGIMAFEDRTLSRPNTDADIGTSGIPGPGW